jgi:PAS domain S-box-containing protein
MIVGLANHTILVRKDGTEVPIDDSGAPIRDRDGKTMGVVLVFRDITERKRMEERTEHLASYPQLNPNPVIEVDIFGTITFSNPSSEAMLQKLGLDKKDLKILLSHDLDAILRDWDKKSESTFYREVLLADRVLGETVHLVPQFKVARVYALDITERKQADEALLQAKEAWERTFASVPDLIAIIDNQYRILRVNEAMARRLGIKPEEAIGLICYEAVHGLSEPPDYCPHSRTIKDGRQHIEEVHEDRLGGDFMVSTTPLHDDKGQMIGTVHVAHDITERKQAEGALRESEKRMGRAQEIAHLGSWELDVVNNRLSWSDEIYRIFGVQPQEFGATYDAFLEAVHPDDRAAVDAAYAGSLRERRDSYEIEHRVVRKSDGEVRFVHEKCEHVRDGAGRIIRSVGMVHDVTERKKAEDALQKAHNELEQRVKERTAELTRAYEKLETEMAERTRVEEQLRQSQKMEAVGTLAGGIAHDFNNMLAAIIGNAELAMDDVPEEMTARHNLDQIFKAGMRARGLVRQILTFSRKAEHERKPIALAPLVNETFKLLRASLPTTIEMRLNIDTVSDVVLADPVQIQQVLMNLCTNAGDAMRDTGGRLEVSLADTVLGGPLPEEGMQPGTYVTLTVSDTGHGMDEDVKSRIFEPFFTTKERGQGTGMGLAVVYGIVQSHQGVITVMSQPEQGATFTVYLPRHTSGEKADEPTSRPVPKGRERILFVDDEEMLVEMAEGMLGHLGYRVTGTTDSMSALQTFAQDPGAFDLVLTDHTMPQMTGAVLAQKLKEIRPDIPVILCTGYSETISKEKAESMGIDGFVMKPLSRNELGEVVRRVLDKKAKD